MIKLLLYQGIDLVLYPGLFFFFYKSLMTFAILVNTSISQGLSKASQKGINQAINAILCLG